MAGATASFTIFDQLFDKFGLPKAIKSNNGPPFASTRALGGLTPLHERMQVDMRFDLEDCLALRLSGELEVGRG